MKRRSQTAAGVKASRAGGGGRARKPVSYRENSDSASSSSSSDDEPLAIEAARRYSARKGSHRRQIISRRPRSSKSISASRHVPSKKIPWSTLPYQIWLQIFLYDWDPPDVRDQARSHTSLRTHSARAAWLFQCTLTCRNFAEPALSALYHTPPLQPAWKAHALLKRVKDDPHTTYINYRNMIQYLLIEDPLVFGRRFNKHDPISVTDFFPFCPQLKGLLVSRLGTSPLLQSFRIPRSKQYSISSNTDPDVPTLNEAHLREWHWAGHSPTTLHDFRILEVHRTAPFQTLRHITFTSTRAAFDDVTDRTLKLEEDNAAKVAAALAVLPFLRSVRFNKTMLFSQHVLPSLPVTVRLLEITDCSLTSEALSSFLLKHGQNLRSLILDHNDTLNLSFLTNLGVSCPYLELLHMDLRFIPMHLAFKDSEPKFDQLLPAGLIPTWPTTLQSLELFHLRKWDTEAAGRFFTSLADAAGSLPSLRNLRIKASIEESAWRKRIDFRDSWIARLRRIFLRPFLPPRSFAPPVRVALSQKRKARESSSDSEQSAPAPRRSSRRKEAQSQSAEASRPSSPEAINHESEDVVQAMCNVVDIAIDNLRPAAEQLNEGDFLDEEASGDSDWSEGKEQRRLEAEERSAW